MTLRPAEVDIIKGARIAPRFAHVYKKVGVPVGIGIVGVFSVAPFFCERERVHVLRGRFHFSQLVGRSPMALWATVSLYTPIAAPFTIVAFGISEIHVRCNRLPNRT